MLPLGLRAQSWAWDDGTVPYVQTPMEIVERMLRMAEVHSRRLRDRSRLGRRPHRDRGGEARRARAGRRSRSQPGEARDREREQARRRRARRASRCATSSRPIFRARPWSTIYLLPDFNAKLLPRLLGSSPARASSRTTAASATGRPTRRSRCARRRSRSASAAIRKVELWIVPADAQGDWVERASRARRHAGVQYQADTTR